MNTPRGRFQHDSQRRREAMRRALSALPDRSFAPIWERIILEDGQAVWVTGTDREPLILIEFDDG